MTGLARAEEYDEIIDEAGKDGKGGRTNQLKGIGPTIGGSPGAGDSAGTSYSGESLDEPAFTLFRFPPGELN